MCGKTPSTFPPFACMGLLTGHVCAFSVLGVARGGWGGLGGRVIGRGAGCASLVGAVDASRPTFLTGFPRTSHFHA